MQMQSSKMGPKKYIVEEIVCLRNLYDEIVARGCYSNAQLLA